MEKIVLLKDAGFTMRCSP